MTSPHAGTPVLRATDLRKTFHTKAGPVEAVRGVDLTVRPGEILGLLGPNGAGKTTVLRILTTLLTPSGGSAELAGHELRTDPAGVRRRIGYIAQGSGTDPQADVREELTTQGRLYRLTRAEAETRTTELARQLGLTELLDRPCGSLSGGQRRRLDIALGLTHRPPLLLLDEPTTGLDPGSRADLWDLLRRLSREDGTAVLLSTHYLDEADALADRLVVIDGGRVIAEDTPQGLKAAHGGDAGGTLQDAYLALTGRVRPAADAAPVAV